MQPPEISATEIVSQHRKPENSDFPRSSCAAARHSLGSVIGWPASHQLPVPAFATYAGEVGDGGGGGTGGGSMNASR